MNSTFRIETFERKNLFGKWRFYFRLVIKRNGEIVAASEAYNDRRDRNYMVDLLRSNLGGVDIVPVPR